MKRRVLLLFAILLPMVLFGAVGCTTTHSGQITSPMSLGDPGDVETQHLADVAVVGVERKTVDSVLWLDKIGLGHVVRNQEHFLIDERSSEEKKHTQITHLSSPTSSNSAFLGGLAIGGGLIGGAAVADSPSSSSNSRSSSAADASAQ